jgi:hypothetical protein
MISQFWLFMGFLGIACGGFTIGAMFKTGKLTVGTPAYVYTGITGLGMLLAWVAGLGFIYVLLMAAVVIGLGAYGDKLVEYMPRVASKVESNIQRGASNMK